MLIYRHYKLHLHFDTVWRHVKNLGFLKKCILDISWKLVRLDLQTPLYTVIIIQYYRWDNLVPQAQLIQRCYVPSLWVSFLDYAETFPSEYIN